MITTDNFKQLLINIGFTESVNTVSEINVSDLFVRKFNFQNCELKADFLNKELIYPSEIIAHRETTKNFSQKENFVVFECICRLLERGYLPNHIELEKPMPGGHHDTGGFCDIIVKDNNNKPYLLIECKTPGYEFGEAWKKMLLDGGQLFNYYNSYRQAEFLCLYASDFVDEHANFTSYIISMKDNDEYLRSDKKLLSFGKVQEDNGGKDDYFKVWKETYQQDFATNGIFESGITAFHVGKQKYSINDLKEVDNSAIQKKYHEFATILRQHNVSGRENAFDKLVNLFLAKIVDETTNPNELMFYWKGAAFDDYFNFQDRLQKMYKDGMQKFLGETVTYIDNETIKETFHLFKNDPDAIRDKILGYFRELKFFTNNDFAFLDVHNEQLFFQNAIILKKIVQMLQDIKLKTETQNQFLGDLFEGFLDQGVKQSEGQFFTPMPIVKFLISALPLENLIKNSAEIPKAIDYACGAGHFLNEYAHQIKPFVEAHKADEVSNYYAEITGIEKEYRLSKVAKVSAFMYGQDEIKIIYSDALAQNKGINDKSYSVLVANPPYSVKGFLETLSEEERNRFELINAIDTKQIISNNSIETFFIERAKQLLKSGGVAAIVLPSSILSNGNIYIKCREIILKYFDIVAIAEFGSGTFGKTGTNTVTLFLRRKTDNPDTAEHLQNRVNAWFKNDFSKDVIFEDNHLLTDYCNHININPENYKTLLSGKPNDALWVTDIFKEYHKAFENDTKARNIRNKRITASYTEKNKQEELEKYILSAIISAEKEKLYYYLLAADNPQPVLISKSPSDSKAMKQFLGYEWSGAKGSEGIKYLGTNVTDDEDMIAANKGINQIRTPLFNPTDFLAPDKINTLIRQNFNAETIHIPESLKEFVSFTRLVDMIDFSRVSFDKALRTSAVKNIEIESKYPLVILNDCVETLGGLWTGKKPPFIKVSVIRNTNFTMKGELKLDDVAQIDVEENSFAKRKLQKGDIIIEKSGGSETQAVGRVVLFNLDNGDFAYSNFTARLRIVNKNLIPNYLHLILNKIYQDGLTFNYQNGSSGLKNLDLERYLTIKIPLPSLTIQNQIVSECEKVDEEYNISRMSVEEYKKRISQVFKIHEVILN